jgi:hypothetical protein
MDSRPEISYYAYYEGAAQLFPKLINSTSLQNPYTIRRQGSNEQSGAAARTHHKH